MITKEISNSLKQACQELLNAETELNRPMEDVVTLSACQSVRNSMKQIMEIYLTGQSVEIKGNASLHDLHDSCLKINRSFADVDLSNIECKGTDHAHCDGKYCLTIENVNNCITAANQLKSLVWQELKVTD